MTPQQKHNSYLLVSTTCSTTLSTNYVIKASTCNAHALILQESNFDTYMFTLYHTDPIALYQLTSKLPSGIIDGSSESGSGSRRLHSHIDQSIWDSEALVAPMWSI